MVQQHTITLPTVPLIIVINHVDGRRFGSAVISQRSGQRVGTSRHAFGDCTQRAWDQSSRVRGSLTHFPSAIRQSPVVPSSPGRERTHHRVSRTSCSTTICEGLHEHAKGGRQSTALKHAQQKWPLSRVSSRSQLGVGGWGIVHSTPQCCVGCVRRLWTNGRRHIITTARAYTSVSQNDPFCTTWQVMQ